MNSAGKLRLDQLLVERGLAPSRQKAQALIMGGSVLIDDVPVEKAGHRVPVDANVRIRGEHSKYVGRGGDKLEGALDVFKIDLQDIVALDVGASTGGFTDCMLLRGAKLVYAVDVGYNQLDLKLRNDPRVIVHERQNARELDSLEFDPPPTFATIDVSFISVRKVLKPTVATLQAPFRIVVLVKPQFELGRESVGKGGVVRDEALQLQSVELVSAFAREIGLEVVESVPSPLRGEKKGNQEYFLLLKG